MALISLTNTQVVDVIKNEMQNMMVDYCYGYDSPDAEAVCDFYKVWDFYATMKDQEQLFNSYPEIELIVKNWR
jgi:hypothetical protein